MANFTPTDSDHSRDIIKTIRKFGEARAKYNKLHGDINKLRQQIKETAEEIEGYFKQIKTFREKNDLVSPGNMGHDARMADFFALIGQNLKEQDDAST